jgi:hypothetical protein
MALSSTTWPRNGFTLVTRNDSEGYVRNYPAAASTNQPIAIGDVVCLLNGVAVPATAGQDPSLVPFGIVTEVLTSAGRPFTHQTTKIIASAGVGRVRVCYDPMAEYVVRCETSVGPSNIGKNVTLVASGANATTGRSYQSVLIPASASVGDMFKIVCLSPFGELGGKDTGGGAGNGVIVRFNKHLLQYGTAGQ